MAISTECKVLLELEELLPWTLAWVDDIEHAPDGGLVSGKGMSPSAGRLGREGSMLWEEEEVFFEISTSETFSPCDNDASS